ncbi:MAG: hypothetical protein JST43_01960 [Bacteroidetes bacterium]|nr:hypothetical protein [Bacteroidota bacterium]MBS1541987.1 hypothetical protein [Bacteroidota bacterium]
MRLTESLLIGLAAGLVLYSISVFFALNFSLCIYSAFGAALTVFGYLSYPLLKIRSNDVVRYLNQQYPTLEQSADLLLQKGELGLLQQVLHKKVDEQLEKIYSTIQLPHHLLRAFVVFIVCSSLSFLLLQLKPLDFKTASQAPPGTVGAHKDKIPSAIQAFEVVVSPPAYTGLSKSASQSQFSLAVPEGSLVSWKIWFSGSVKKASLLLSGKDSLVFSKNENYFTLKKEILQSGFYQLKWQDEHSIYYSDFYRIESTADAPPKVEITNLNQFTKISVNDPHQIAVTARISDDYSISDASIVATVSKGSGESLKFREERLQFDKPHVMRGKILQAERLIDLKLLRLDPGDELYFYVEATDNKTPIPNKGRTETFFIALQDTTQSVSIVDDALGVDLMPDYFRSQRQIIIDTEKLLKEKLQIPISKFNATSNELGFDQKTLRLKYGQFLGEEADSGIGAEATHEKVENTKEENLALKFGHQHDTENEHHLVEEKKDHHHEGENAEDKKNPLAAFSHNHDNTEVATFFEQSIRAKLKAALTVMWDAELHLRLYQPAQSLPYQYQALKLLKEISQASRIYVHRSGFDPPPLKEEKRLTADLSDVISPSAQSTIDDNDPYTHIKSTIRLIEQLLHTNDIVTPHDRQIINKAGEELAQLALQNPSLLPGLSLLKDLTDAQNLVEKDKLIQLEKIMWHSLPVPMRSPSQQGSPQHKANQLFFQQLKKVNE